MNYLLNYTSILKMLRGESKIIGIVSKHKHNAKHIVDELKRKLTFNNIEHIDLSRSFTYKIEKIHRTVVIIDDFEVELSLSTLSAMCQKINILTANNNRLIFISSKHMKSFDHIDIEYFFFKDLTPTEASLYVFNDKAHTSTFSKFSKYFDLSLHILTALKQCLSERNSIDMFISELMSMYKISGVDVPASILYKLFKINKRNIPISAFINAYQQEYKSAITTLTKHGVIDRCEEGTLRIKDINEYTLLMMTCNYMDRAAITALFKSNLQQ